MMRRGSEPIHHRAPILFRSGPIINRNTRRKFPQDVEAAFDVASVLKLPPAGGRRVLNRGGEAVIPGDHKQPHGVLVFGIFNMLRVRARLSPSKQKVEHRSVAISTLKVR